MRLLFILASAILLAGLISACTDKNSDKPPSSPSDLDPSNDPKAANDSNFRIALQEYLDSEATYCVRALEMPSRVSADHPWIRWMEATGFAQNIPGTYYFGLTKLGEQHYTPRKGFCYGKARVARILLFSEPANLMGQTISNVKYEIRVENIQEWAVAIAPRGSEFYSGEFEHNTTRSLRRLADVVNSHNAPIQDKATLVLTSKGWMHESLLE